MGGLDLVVALQVPDGPVELLDCVLGGPPVAVGLQGGNVAAVEHALASVLGGLGSLRRAARRPHAPAPSAFAHEGEASRAIAAQGAEEVGRVLALAVCLGLLGLRLLVGLGLIVRLGLI